MDLQQLADSIQRPSVFDLDMAAVGNALVTAALISKLMGHALVPDTVRDYLRPHEDIPGREATPEQRFVHAVLSGHTDECVTDAEASLFLQTADLP